MPDRSPDQPEPFRTGSPAVPPPTLTRFIGRDTEITNLRRLLATCRLVTLTGSGGSGKTRLAQELSTSVADDFPGGVFWVELSPLQHGALVTEQVAEALGIPSRRGTAGYDVIVRQLTSERTLLVLDNCEHVVRSAAELTATLLPRCPQLVVLATSREALAIPGETAWLVPPLSLPEPGALLSPEAAARFEAIRLFLDRAAEVMPSFRLSPANTADVVSICRRLDGIPLALELAAARLRALGPAQLLARLGDAFSVLTTRTRTALPRRRTLRATIAWSYDMLTPEERRLLDSLSVFAGTFDLESVEHVCRDDVLPEDDILDLVSNLVEKSLVEVLEYRSEVRYRLLETVRQYADEQLEQGGRSEEVRRRHSEYFITLVEAAEPHFTERGRRVWLDRMAQDMDNLRQVLAWTRESNPKAHLRLSGKLGWYWFGTEHWSEGRRWLEEALALPEGAEPTPERASVLFGLGMLTALQGRSSVAQTALQECLGIANELGDPVSAAYARLYLGLSLAADGQAEAIPYLEAALAHCRGAEDLYGERLALLCLGASAAAEGSLDRAAELTEAGLAAARAFGEDRELAVSLRQLAVVELRRGEPARAVDLAREALSALVRDPQHYFIAMSLEVLACALSDLQRPSEAARLFGAGERTREGIGVAVARIDVPMYEPRVAAIRRALGEAEFAEAWAAGRDLGVWEALAYGQAVAPARDTAPRSGVRDAVPDGGTPVPESSAPPVDRLVAPESVEGSSSATVGLEVRALGPLEIVLDGRVVEAGAWSHSRPRELLLYLLCHPGGRTRHEVGEALWPDSTPAQVKNSFHVALHHLRKTLGRPDWVRLDNERYRIAHELGIRFDAAEFEAAVQSGRRAVSRNRESGMAFLREALELYRGDFLAEESVRDWHFDQRDHLRSVYADGMLTLGEVLMETGSAEEAVAVFKRVVLLDDLHEGAHRQLMTAYARTGQRQLAIRVYERLASLLRDELSARPEADTVDLHRRILAAEPV